MKQLFDPATYRGCRVEKWDYGTFYIKSRQAKKKFIMVFERIIWDWQVLIRVRIATEHDNNWKTLKPLFRVEEEQMEFWKFLEAESQTDIETPLFIEFAEKLFTSPSNY